MSRLKEPVGWPGLPLGTEAGSPLADRVHAFFGGLGLRGRVVMCQLPLSVTLVLVVTAAAVFHPETLAAERFQFALLAHAALFGVSLALPWGRLPAGAYTVIPVLDCVAIGFTREAGGPSFSVLSILLAFPVIWLSVDRRRAGVVLAVAATVLSTVLPAAAFGTAPTQLSMIRTIFLPLVMAAIALTAHVVAGTLYRQRQTLVRKDEALADTVAESVQRQVDQDGQDVLTNNALQVSSRPTAPPPCRRNASRRRVRPAAKRSPTSCTGPARARTCARTPSQPAP
ncbi:hypothetical protein [Arthrobacter sp. ISL-65]|uniref:hypothetical protein n=1 Tax=Arthrobacter sp. ISL-65 TaxID=2819112 RepID=UPI00203585BD|nr:hypothetical protein [Arthrobacter sp. ISL-65]